MLLRTFNIIESMSNEQLLFEQEVSTLGQSESFMTFLAGRSQGQNGISLEDFERQLEAAERREREDTQKDAEDEERGG
jgi:hypothetical protein